VAVTMLSSSELYTLKGTTEMGVPLV
jgi:hypothetical protein